MNKIKFGVDYHGVYEKYYNIFNVFNRLLIDNKHEVHLITGEPIEDNIKFKTKLKKMGNGIIHFTHMFSITDYLIDNDFPYVQTHNGIKFINEDWDSAKARYCLDNNITLMVDDSEIYGTYFKTPYIRLK